LKNRPVQFRFYKPKTKKSNRTQIGKKPSQTGKKPSQTKKIEQRPSQTEQTEPNRFEQVFVLKNRTEPKPVGLDLVSGFF
jgi:hypothetical protein